MNTVLFLIGCCFTSLVSASLPQNIHDSEEARHLFHLADINSDYLLTPNEFHSVFLSFDLNNDTHLSSDEFLQDWTTKNLGTAIEAVTLFHHLDVNKDGVIEESIDLPWIIKFFDRSEDGHINESEFVVQWVKIKSSDNYYHHSYVHHGYMNNYHTKSSTPSTKTTKTTTTTSNIGSKLTINSGSPMVSNMTLNTQTRATTTTVMASRTQISTTPLSSTFVVSKTSPATIKLHSTKSTMVIKLPTSILSTITVKSSSVMPSKTTNPPQTSISLFSTKSSPMMIKTSTVRPTTLPTITTVHPTTVLPTTTVRQPTSCYVCSGPTFICEQRFHSQQCPSTDQQYCINNMVNNRDGTRTVDRRCATKDECVNRWINHTSHRTECTLYNVNKAYAYHFECSFCCHASECNRDLIPSNLYLIV